MAFITHGSLLVFLPHIILEDDWHQDWGGGCVCGKLKKVSPNLRLLLRPTISDPSPSSLA